MDIVFIDHYDSFSFNVKEWIQSHLPQPLRVTHIFCDDDASLQRIALAPRPLVLSPGPGHPRDAQGTLALVKTCLGHVPILGICLGHQILGTIGGGEITRARDPFHGTVRKVTLKEPLFNLPRGALLQMGVYHSLVVRDGSLAPPWRVIAYDEMGEIAAIELREPLPQGTSHHIQTLWPAVGLQFHPESFLSIESAPLVKGWLSRDVLPWFNRMEFSMGRT